MPTTMQWFGPGEGPLDDCHAIRVEVFCSEQGYSLTDEMDDQDPVAHHLLLRKNGLPTGTGRLLIQPGGTVRLGRIALRRSARGTGAGAALVAEMIRRAQALGARQIVVDAQCRVVGFYEKCGFAVSGEEHMDGHVPHVWMTWQG